jgi:hypothetical protein
VIGDGEIVYVGIRGPSGPRIEVEGRGGRRPLGGLRRNPAIGFEWGYRGAGPHNTAQSILREVLGREPGLKECRRFTWEVVANLPRVGFRLSGSTVRAWARRHLR